MIDAGLISEAEAENHPKANIITKAVGASASIELECRTYDLLADDVFLLCSDGLNKVLTDAEIAHSLNVKTRNDYAALANSLITTALTRRAKDNVTCVAVFPGQKTSWTDHCLDSTLPLGTR